MKNALLLTRSWTQIATVQFVRKEWPGIIMWNDRAFVKATTGHVAEKYVERAVVHAKKVIERSQYVEKRL